jgi:hypothetical protein
VARAINGNTLVNANITDERIYATPVGAAIRGWKQVGPPVSGTYVAGQYGFDAANVLWFCSVAGTPGTWVPAASVRISRLTGAITNPLFTLPAGFNEWEIRWSAIAAADTLVTLRFNADNVASGYFANGVQIDGTTVSGFDYEGTGVPPCGKSGGSGSRGTIRIRTSPAGWTFWESSNSAYQATDAKMNYVAAGGLYKFLATQVELTGVFTGGHWELYGYV